MKTAYKDYLTDECFDIDDLIRWTKTQMDSCAREDHLDIYTRYLKILEKIKNNSMIAEYRASFGRENKPEKTFLIDST